MKNENTTLHSWLSTTFCGDVQKPVPGTLNQGAIVGKRKGLVFSGIQNGAVLPCGTPDGIDGTVAPATASVLSGKACAGSFGALEKNKTNKNK